MSGRVIYPLDSRSGDGRGGLGGAWKSGVGILKLFVGIGLCDGEAKWLEREGEREDGGT